MNIDRRGFLGMIGGVMAGAAVQQWPFRVYSFPSDVKAAEFSEILRVLNDPKTKFARAWSRIPALDPFVTQPLYDFWQLSGPAETLFNLHDNH